MGAVLQIVNSLSNWTWTFNFLCCSQDAGA